MTLNDYFAAVADKADEQQAYTPSLSKRLILLLRLPDTADDDLIVAMTRVITQIVIEKKLDAGERLFQEAFQVERGERLRLADEVTILRARLEIAERQRDVLARQNTLQSQPPIPSLKLGEREIAVLERAHARLARDMDDDFARADWVGFESIGALDPHTQADFGQLLLHELLEQGDSADMVAYYRITPRGQEVLATVKAMQS